MKTLAIPRPRVYHCRYQESAEGGSMTHMTVTRQDLESDPLWPYMREALDYTEHGRSFTSKGLLTVAGIYNMAAWASWKSSSLGKEEQSVATTIQSLKLYQLMDINKDKRMSAAALFRSLPVVASKAR